MPGLGNMKSHALRGRGHALLGERQGAQEGMCLYAVQGWQKSHKKHCHLPVPTSSAVLSPAHLPRGQILGQTETVKQVQEAKQKEGAG